MAVSKTSPFFDRRKRPTCRKRHAMRSFFPPSTWETSNTNRSLLLSLGDNQAGLGSAHQCYGRRKIGCCFCDQCSTFIENAKRHFDRCSIFKGRWSDWKIDDDSKCCLESAERRLDHSVRHLCYDRCYLRAFAPCRDWLALCNSVREETDCPLYDILAGWRCFLVFCSNSDVCKTAFAAPNGKTFETTSQALGALQCGNTRGGTPLQSRQRKRLFTSRRPANFSNQLDLGFTVSSPFGFLEELFSGDPWKLLICAILLNRTRRIQVDSVMHQFLLTWPNAEKAACADLVDLHKVIRGLGMHVRRAEVIKRFSREYLQLLRLREGPAAFRLTKKEIFGLYGCGDYAFGAYRLFVLQQIDFEPDDHALRAYAEVQRRRRVESFGHEECLRKNLNANAGMNKQPCM